MTDVAGDLAMIVRNAIAYIKELERQIHELKQKAEPVAWMHTDPDKPSVAFLEWRENEPGYRGDWIKTPLYAARPRRDPLTDEEIKRLVSNDMVQFARAIERAHGIGGQP